MTASRAWNSRVGYLMSHYPAVSHAFVLREVQELRRAGVDVSTISIHATDQAELLAAADKHESARTFAVLPISLRRLCAVHLRALLKAPRAYLRTLVFALAIGRSGLRGRLWNLFYFAEAMVVWRHCQEVGISHLHAQFADSATDVAMLVDYFEESRGARGFSWSLTVHGSVEFYNVEKYALAAKLQRADFALAVSDFGRSQLMTLSDPRRWPHIHVVHCGVDPTIYHSGARPSDREVVTILFVGRLLPGKGLTILFEAMSELGRRNLAVRLVVVGDGPARHDLESAAREDGVAERVDFVGAIGQDDIRHLYAAADIFCLPSFAEGIPVVLMEAMAMEIPVVSSMIMGIPELVTDGVEGLLVPAGRADRLADVLEKLIVSPEMRQRMGSAGRQKVSDEFDVRDSARRLRDIMERELSDIARADPHTNGLK